MNDHEAARRHLAVIQDLVSAAIRGAPGAEHALHTAVSEYTRLMREHIQKEEQRLFNVARALLGPQDVARLQREFDEVEQEPLGAAFHERYEALAGRLCVRPSG